MNLYWKDRNGKLYEFEASTKSGEYAWFRSLHTDESVRLKMSSLTHVPDAVVLAMAREFAS